jgi:rhodanese-related sulfurtransferase
MKENKNRMYLLVLVLVLGILHCGIVPLLAAEQFPARKNYPEVTPISTEDLYKDYMAGNVVVVDVRSKLEYDVIHVTKAKHISLSNKTFFKQVRDLIAENGGKKVVFYCNGITCLKSYEAAKRSLKAGFKNCYAYDAGIPEWAALFSEETLLLGKTIVDPEKQLIPKSAFKQRVLPFDEFKAKSAATGGMVIDVRDHIQRSKSLPGLEKARHITLDRFLKYFVMKQEHQDKTLYIFDQVGKQVKWLQYYLKDNGYEQYLFLKGGASSVLAKQEYK